MAQAQKITPRATDFSEWYNDVIMQAHARPTSASGTTT